MRFIPGERLQPGPAPGLISLMTPAATAALIRPATDIKDRPVMTQVEEDVPSTPTIDRLGSSLPQRTKGVPEEPDYVMDVVRTWAAPTPVPAHPFAAR